jgi:hypothetical protein
MNELSSSAMDFYGANWPSAQLTIQRRAYKDLLKVVSKLIYNGTLEGASYSTDEAKHPYTTSLLKFFAGRYPECENGSTSVIFFEIVGKGAIMDDATKP